MTKWTTAVTRQVSGLALPLLAAGCATTATDTDSASVCVGGIERPPRGLVGITDSALLDAAVGQPGKGGLCKGRVYEARQEVTVYRVGTMKHPRANLADGGRFLPRRRLVRATVKKMPYAPPGAP
ncbi:MAG: hypothetical protein HOI95_07720 [Chromatiales bacterium]|jgi:hypothetical protein|nr:hypothetical protein [Chromatiales bacterium]